VNCRSLFELRKTTYSGCNGIGDSARIEFLDRYSPPFCEGFFGKGTLPGCDDRLTEPLGFVEYSGSAGSVDLRGIRQQQNVRRGNKFLVTLCTQDPIVDPDIRAQG